MRNSTPERQRLIYGDFDFDWEHRVNTMSGGVGWRERLLGELYSLYQPTEPAVFHEMMQTLRNMAIWTMRSSCSWISARAKAARS